MSHLVPAPPTPTSSAGINVCHSLQGGERSPASFCAAMYRLLQPAATCRNVTKSVVFEMPDMLRRLKKQIY